MNSGKQDLGVLGKLAAVATAITAILTLVFVLKPDWKPSVETGPPTGTAGTATAPIAVNGTGAAAQSLKPEGATAIRGVLAADQAATAREEAACAPLDQKPPMPNASPDDQARYLVKLAEHFARCVRATEDGIASLEGVRLVATPVEFQRAMQVHLKSLRERREALVQTESLATRAALDIRIKGSSAYLNFFTALDDLNQRTTRLDTAVAQTWADVKAAAVSVGIE